MTHEGNLERDLKVELNVIHGPTGWRMQSFLLLQILTLTEKESLQKLAVMMLISNVLLATSQADNGVCFSQRGSWAALIAPATMRLNSAGWDSCAMCPASMW